MPKCSRSFSSKVGRRFSFLSVFVSVFVLLGLFAAIFLAKTGWRFFPKAASAPEGVLFCSYAASGGGCIPVDRPWDQLRGVAVNPYNVFPSYESLGESAGTCQCEFPYQSLQCGIRWNSLPGIPALRSPGKITTAYDSPSGDIFLVNWFEASTNEQDVLHFRTRPNLEYVGPINGQDWDSVNIGTLKVYDMADYGSILYVAVKGVWGSTEHKRVYSFHILDHSQIGVQELSYTPISIVRPKVNIQHFYTLDSLGFIRVYDSADFTRTPLYTWTRLPGAVDLAVDASENVFVAFPCFVKEYTSDGLFLNKYGTGVCDGGNDQFQMIKAIDVGLNNDFYVADNHVYTDEPVGMRIKKWSCVLPSPTPTLLPGVYLNSASGKTCNQICAQNGKVCADIGTNTRATDDSAWYWSYDHCNIGPRGTRCAAVMQNTGHICQAVPTSYPQAKPANWTYCKCVNPTPDP